MARRKGLKRTTIKPRKGDKRFVRRSKTGKFTNKQSDAGRSLSRDRRSKAKRTVPKGQGDRGDQRRRKAT